MKPPCYPNQKLYDEWQHAARYAREECTPCTDCSKAYAAEMQESGRCQPKQVKSLFRLALNGHGLITPLPTTGERR